MKKKQVVYALISSAKDLSVSPFMDKSVYRQIKADGGISPETADLITHCRSTYASPLVCGGLEADALHG